MCETLLLTVAQAAQRLQLGRSMTYRLIQTGALVSVRVGAARRVIAADLEDFVERLKTTQQEDV